MKTASRPSQATKRHPARGNYFSASLSSPQIEALERGSNSASFHRTKVID